MAKSKIDWKLFAISIIIGVLSVILKLSYFITIVILLVAGAIYLISKGNKE